MNLSWTKKMLRQIHLNFLLAFLFCLSARIHAKFPVDPKPCKYGDIDCITKTMEYFLHEKSDGDGSINLVRIDPLEVKQINIKQGAESPVNIELEFNKNKIYGLKNSKVIKLKGFGKDLTQKHEIILRVPQIDLVGNYKINGKILILPIAGSGTSNITLYNLDMRMLFTGTAIEKSGATYMNVEKFRLDLEPRGMHYKIDNLFNGDKALGDNMNLFLNENWQDIFRELKTSVSSAFGQIFHSVIGHAFAKYPYAQLFSE